MVQELSKQALSANPQIGRVEALRRSMVELNTKGAPHEAHPANWAPFVLVGDAVTSPRSF
jgi:CHAT domain-containing protein